jgi:arylsulfatase A-like enzyme
MTLHFTATRAASAALVCMTAFVVGCPESPAGGTDAPVASPVSEVRYDTMPSAFDYQATYALIDALGSMKAEPAPTLRKPVSAPTYEIGTDQRLVLYQHPASIYRFGEVPAGPGHRLAIAPVMHPKAFGTATNGVGFEIRCKGAAGETVELLSMRVSPASNPADRIWHDRDLPLDACSTPTTELSLETTCGPHGNCASDWAAWGNPRVLYEQRMAPKPERLVLMISIDTLRPDHLGVYGYARKTSPALDRLAADSVVFETVVATSPWTIPSHAALLSSTFPRVHRATAETPISSSVSLLAEVLVEAGWQTAGFIDTPYMSVDRGFGRGFEHYDDLAPPSGNNRRTAEIVRERLLSWLAQADERPTFAFWHIMDVHGPYGAPAPFGGRFRSTLAPANEDPRLGEMRNLSIHDYLELDRFASFDELVATYDEGIASVDHVIGGLLDVLRDAGLYEDALILVTSDHGESLLDRGIWVGHGLFLTDDEIRVPLIVKLPGNAHAGTRVGDLVSQIDIAPTLLDSLSVMPPATFVGESLLPLAAGKPRPGPRTAYGFSNNTGASFIRTQDSKFISGQSAENLAKHMRYKKETPLPAHAARESLYYDLANDPGEQTALKTLGDAEEAKRLPRLVETHIADAEARVGDAPVEKLAEPSEETRQRLRALGYVE